MKVHFDRIPPTLIAEPDKLKDILSWYRRRHPIWFSWLDLD